MSKLPHVYKVDKLEPLGLATCKRLFTHKDISLDFKLPKPIDRALIAQVTGQPTTEPNVNTCLPSVITNLQ